MVINTYNEQNLSYGNNILSEEDNISINELLEQVLDKIADELINSPFVDPETVSENQKTIREGIISLGRTNADRLVLYQKDIKANQEDLLGKISSNQNLNFGEEFTLRDIVTNFYLEGFEINQILIGLRGAMNNGINITIYADEGNSYNITSLLLDGENNPLNVSQFVNISQEATLVDPTQANEYLDTNIYELLPDAQKRQERINNLFLELSSLLPPDIEDKAWDNDGDGYVDLSEDTLTWIGSNDYYWNWTISATQDDVDQARIEEESSFITRLRENASSQNQGKTIEDIYNIVTPYLRDIIEEQPKAQDERPEYQNQSEGYLKFRNLNQGIIIRNGENNFIEGLNSQTKDYLTTGFTITMWVRFLDKSSEGTLFNYGNPTRAELPFGFRLETYVLDKDDPCPHTNHTTWGTAADAISDWGGNFFSNSNTARFVRLVVNDNGTLRDSHVGVNHASKFANIPDNDGVGSDEFRLLQTTFIPENFDEWYFICATFNPTIDEDNSFDKTFNKCIEYDGDNNCNYDFNFWNNHIDETGFVTKSTYGNRCKVEMISKTDLLRARGYKV